eukprot:10662428-Prorocentrum_lima.AAC.1
MTSSLVGSEIVYKRQLTLRNELTTLFAKTEGLEAEAVHLKDQLAYLSTCLLYTSDAADDM